MNQNNHFLKKQYLKILFPLMFSVLGGTINALIDSVLVSQSIGEIGLAAVNASLPVYLVLCTFGALIAGGAWVMSTQSIGQEEIEEANQTYHNGLFLAGIVSVVFTVAGVCFSPVLSTLLAPEGAISEAVKQYCLISFIGSFPCIFLYFPSFYLQLEGKGKQITYSIIIMIATDCILDVVFLFWFQWGMYGAATASVIANMACCGFGFWKLERDNSNFVFSRKLLHLQQVLDIVKNGSPVALGNFYDAFRLLLLNSMIAHNCDQKTLATWAILNTMSELTLMISSGVPQAAAPMMGVYYSARENSRIRILVRLQVVVGSIISSVFATILVVLNRPIQGMFQSTETLILPFLCLGFMTWLQMLSGIWSEHFHVTQRIGMANFQVFLKRMILPVITLFVMLKSGGYIWLFLPISAALTILFSGVMVKAYSLSTQKKKRPLTGILLLDDYLQRENKVIDFSVEANSEKACQASEQIVDFCMKAKMDSKQMMKIQLAIEELINILITRVDKVKYIDARAYAFDDIIGIQFRYAGQPYNPFEDESEDVEFELQIIKKIGEEFRHNYTLGMNTINFCFMPADVQEKENVQKRKGKFIGQKY